jgi:predicted lipopolysaccharide heptosyltransferase III
MRPAGTPKADIDWDKVNRVLVVKLRSIGDTVLSTPSLFALRRALPDARIDILLEDWVAPLLEGSPLIDNVLSTGKSVQDRIRTGWKLQKQGYDVVFDLHGGTTAAFLTAATRAPHRVGYSYYQYPFLHNHLYDSPVDFWQTEAIHSAEQQLALLGFAGIFVEDRPKSRLKTSDEAISSMRERLRYEGLREDTQFALMHPSTAFFTKQWDTANYARTAEFLGREGFATVAVASKPEAGVIAELKRSANVPITVFDDLSLPEITALASIARLFVGNDSGLAHMAAAVNTPTVVVFGSSNRNHWRPWTDAPNEIVFVEFPCQPCPGYECKAFGDPRCIREVPVTAVVEAVKRVLAK